MCLQCFIIEVLNAYYISFHHIIMYKGTTFLLQQIPSKNLNLYFALGFPLATFQRITKIQRRYEICLKCYEEEG